MWTGTPLNVDRYPIRNSTVSRHLAVSRPAFLLGALAALAILISRLNRIVDRMVILNGIPDDDTMRCRLKPDLPLLMQRAAMITRAIFWAVVASISVTLLVIVAFVTAFFQIQHERGVAMFFIISLGAFTI